MAQRGQEPLVAGSESQRQHLYGTGFAGMENARAKDCGILVHGSRGHLRPGTWHRVSLRMTWIHTSLCSGVHDTCEHVNEKNGKGLGSWLSGVPIWRPGHQGVALLDRDKKV